MINLSLNGITIGNGAYYPVPSSFGPVNASLTFSTLFPRRNYQGFFPIRIPGYALSWLRSSGTLSGSNPAGAGDYTAFNETLSVNPDPNSMNQVGLPADQALATTATSATGTLTLLANTQSYV